MMVEERSQLLTDANGCVRDHFVVEIDARLQFIEVITTLYLNNKSLIHFIEVLSITHFRPDSQSSAC